MLTIKIICPLKEEHKRKKILECDIKDAYTYKNWR